MRKIVVAILTCAANDPPSRSHTSAAISMFYVTTTAGSPAGLAPEPHETDHMVLKGQGSYSTLNEALIASLWEGSPGWDMDGDGYRRHSDTVDRWPV